MTLEFEELARDPDTWLRASDRQVILARELWQSFKESLISHRHDSPREAALFEGWMYHAGMAVELATKAALARLEPMRVVGNIKFPGHTEIPGEVERILGELSPEERETLKRYSEAVHWSARYPVPIKPARFMQHKNKRRIKEGPDNRILFDILQRLKEKARQD